MVYQRSPTTLIRDEPNQALLEDLLVLVDLEDLAPAEVLTLQYGVIIGVDHDECDYLHIEALILDVVGCDGFELANPVLDGRGIGVRSKIHAAHTLLEEVLHSVAVVRELLQEESYHLRVR